MEGWWGDGCIMLQYLIYVIPLIYAKYTATPLLIHSSKNNNYGTVISYMPSFVLRNTRHQLEVVNNNLCKLEMLNLYTHSRHTFLCLSPILMHSYACQCYMQIYTSRIWLLFTFTTGDFYCMCVFKVNF